MRAIDSRNDCSFRLFSNALASLRFHFAFLAYLPASCFAQDGSEGVVASTFLLADPPAVDATGREFPDRWSKLAPIFLREFVAIDANLLSPRRLAQPLDLRHFANDGERPFGWFLDCDALPRPFRRPSGSLYSG